MAVKVITWPQMMKMSRSVARRNAEALANSEAQYHFNLLSKVVIARVSADVQLFLDSLEPNSGKIPVDRPKYENLRQSILSGVVDSPKGSPQQGQLSICLAEFDNAFVALTCSVANGVVTVMQAMAFVF